MKTIDLGLYKLIDYESYGQLLIIFIVFIVDFLANYWEKVPIFVL